MPTMNAMEFVVLAFMLLIGPLAVLFGVDSRITDPRDRRGSWRTG
jgi:hypothetical protein